MADFATLLQKINTGAQIATTLSPAIQEYGTDHVKATQDVIATIGAGVAAESTNTQTQNEAIASAQLASSLVPMIFQMISLFKKKTTK